MNQTTLGKKIGITFQQIQKYEKGTNRIVASKLFQLANQMDVGIEYFFEGIDKNLIINESNEILKEEHAEFLYEESDQVSTRETISLVKIYNNIRNPNIREKLLLFLKTLADQ
jgi:transcriptional regulator with XRE-family HTH domain